MRYAIFFRVIVENQPSLEAAVMAARNSLQQSALYQQEQAPVIAAVVMPDKPTPEVPQLPQGVLHATQG